MAISEPETADLERRVLAHERVLQELIVYMARKEPRFVDHLREQFVQPMGRTQHQHENRDTDDYAEELIRAAMLLADEHAPQPKAPTTKIMQPGLSRAKERQGTSWDHQVYWDRVQVRERNGIWEVKVDGKFRGDYHRKEHAIAAAAALKLSL